MAAVQVTKEDQCFYDLIKTRPGSGGDGTLRDHRPRVDGTCEWIVTDDTFRQWMASTSGLLWIKGGPGKGKTYLSALLTEWLQRSKERIVIYFFCDSRDVDCNMSIALVRGLLYQLIQQRGELVRYLVPFWEVERQMLFGNAKFEDLWRIFEQIVFGLEGEDIFCVLDGIDELQERSLRQIVLRMNRLFVFGIRDTHRLKLVITSRNLEGRPPVPQTKLQVDLDSEFVGTSADVDRLITAKVAMLAANKRITLETHAELLNIISTALWERAGNNFLWVHFMANDLDRFTLEKLQDAITDLPIELEAVYERVLDRIDPYELPLLRDLLGWVAIAVAPMTVSALKEALGITGVKYLSAKQVCRAKILSCDHLVCFLPPAEDDEFLDQRVTFSHQNARDFVLSSPRLQGVIGVITPVKAADTLIKLVAKYDKSQWLSPLTAYAKAHLVEHLTSLPEEHIDELFRKNAHFFRAIRGNSSKPYFDLKKACNNGLVHLAKLQIETIQSHNFSGIMNTINNGGALLQASLWSDWYMAELLLRKGVKINQSAVISLLTPDEPARLSRFSVLKEAEAFLRADGQPDPPHLSMLHWAASFGSVKVCDFLIEESGYDVDVVDEEGITPLHVAVREGNLELARKLVNTHKAENSMSKPMMNAISQNSRCIRQVMELVAREWGADVKTIKNNRNDLLIHHIFRAENEDISSGETTEKRLRSWLQLGGSRFYLLGSLSLSPLHTLPSVSNLVKADDTFWRAFVMFLCFSQLQISDSRNLAGSSPLHELIWTHRAGEQDPRHVSDAESCAYMGLLIFLLDLGADRSRSNGYGKTPAGLAFLTLHLSRARHHCNTHTVSVEALYILEKYATVPINPKWLLECDSNWFKTTESLDEYTKNMKPVWEGRPRGREACYEGGYPTRDELNLYATDVLRRPLGKGELARLEEQTRHYEDLAAGRYRYKSPKRTKRQRFRYWWASTLNLPETRFKQCGQ